MNKKYLKLGVLLVGLLAFFGGTNLVSAQQNCNKDDCVAIKKDDCIFYGKSHTSGYKIKVTGNDYEFGGDVSNTPIIGYNGNKNWESKMFKSGGDKIKNGNANQSAEELKNQYNDDGCPTVIAFTYDGHDYLDFLFGDVTRWSENGSGLSSKDSDGDTYFAYNVSPSYYTSEEDAKQSRKRGMNVVIKEYNAAIEPYFEELYNKLNGDGNSPVNIDGVGSVTIKTYNMTDEEKSAGYSDVISKNWKLNVPDRVKLEESIGYTKYEKYLGNDNLNTLKSANKDELSSLAKWASSVGTAYEVINEDYQEVLDILNVVTQLYGEGSDISTQFGMLNYPLAGYIEHTYQSATENLVQQANKDECWFCNWLPITTDTDGSTKKREIVTGSIKLYARYTQFAVDLSGGNGNEETNLLSQWTEHINSDLSLYSTQVGKIASMCNAGYNIASDKGYTAIADKFTECSSNIDSVARSLESSVSEFAVSVKTFADNSFNWREDVVVTCENLMSADLIKALSDIYFLIEVAVIAIIVILSMVDFFKATANSDADALKKTWSNIVKRVIVAIVLILLPTIVEFALTQFGMIDEETDIICLDV